MARPKKNNADYFSHDNDMRNDDKIKALRRKYQHIGYSVYNMFLEKLCNAEYFKIEFNEINLELWAGDFEIEPELLNEMLEYFKKINLLQSEDNYIFSEKLINRFDGLLSKRKRDNTRLSPTKKYNKIVIASENPQSKVKESKVKENTTKVVVANKFASQLDIEISKQLAICILETNDIEKNKYKDINNPQIIAKIEKWSQDIEKMQRIDNIDPETIKIVIQWLMKANTSNSNFWNTNIRSGRKLREKFSKLYANAKQDINKINKSKINHYD